MSTTDNLSFFRDGHIHAAEREPDGIGLATILLTTGNGNHRRSLRHAIAFENRHADGGEKSTKLRFQRRGTGNKYVEIVSTQAAANLAVNQLVSKLMLQVINSRPVIVLNLIFQSDIKRPVENGTCRTGFGLSRSLDLLVEFLQDTRNRRHHCRLHLAHGLRNRRQIRHIIHGHAKILVKQHDHILVSMAQRQETQAFLRPF